jgi:sRNA-binding carbon storage regulator CsrA
MSVVRVRRLEGQSVLIGRGIRVTIARVDLEGMIELLVEAPQSVAVSRDDDGLAPHLRKQAKFDDRALLSNRDAR